MNTTHAARLSYVRVPCNDLRAASHAVTDLLGLEPGPASERQAMFRSDQRDHTLAFTLGGSEAVGIELADLDAAVERLTRAGAPMRDADDDECRSRSVRRAVLTRDPSGNAVDLVLRPGIAARRFFPPRDAGITGLRAVALRSLDVAADAAFWTEVVGAEIADWVGDITYLRLDEMHHRVALYPSGRNGILYQSYGITDLNALMQNLYYLNDRQVDIVHGPGREPVSGDAFVRWRVGQDLLFSLATTGDLAPMANGGSRQFMASADSLCAWGSRCEAIPELSAQAFHRTAEGRSEVR